MIFVEQKTVYSMFPIIALVNSEHLDEPPKSPVVYCTRNIRYNLAVGDQLTFLSAMVLKTAFSIMSASSKSFMCLSIMTELSNRAVGLALS